MRLFWYSFIILILLFVSSGTTYPIIYLYYIALIFNSFVWRNFCKFDIKLYVILNLWVIFPICFIYISIDPFRSLYYSILVLFIVLSIISFFRVCINNGYVVKVIIYFINSFIIINFILCFFFIFFFISFFLFNYLCFFDIFYIFLVLLYIIKLIIQEFFIIVTHWLFHVFI